MDNRSNMLQLCRLCLVKDDVNIPIFEEHGDIRQIFLKITSCLPVKVSRDDKLPKKICDGCSYKLETLYEFWNTSVNAEKQLLAWLGEAGMNSEMADGTITAVAQQIKPTDTFVKQETVDPPDVHSEDHDQKDYVFQQKFESASAGPSATVTSNEEEEPPPKRARRTAAVKAAIAMDRDSDDDDDSGEPITKVEDESEESDGEDHTFADAPSTSADDQPGPSGVGKDGVDAPPIIQLDSDSTVILVVSKNDNDDPGENLNSFVENYLLSAAKETEKDVKNKQSSKGSKNLGGSDNISKDSKRDEGNVEINFQCRLCKIFLKPGETFTDHLQLHCSKYEKVKCALCKISLNKKDLRHHRETVHKGKAPGSFKCSVCDKEYLNCSSLKRHYSYHHKEFGIVDKSRIICDTCGRKCMDKDAFTEHYRTHTGEKPYLCTMCPNTFRTRNGLRCHTRTHTGEKPMICKFCGKSFGHNGPYRYHLKTHTGEKPFVCSKCGKGFIAKAHMKAHLLSCPIQLKK